MDTHIDNSPKCHLVTYRAVAINDPFHNRYSTVNIAVNFSFIEITYNLAKISGFVTNVSELPVNDKQLDSPISQ